MPLYQTRNKRRTRKQNAKVNVNGDLIPAKLSINKGPYQRITIKVNESNPQRIKYLDADNQSNTISLRNVFVNTSININEIMKTVKLQIGENSYRFKRLGRTGFRKIANVLSPDKDTRKSSYGKKTNKQSTQKQGTRNEDGNEDGDDVLIPAQLSIHQGPDEQIHIKANESNKHRIHYLDAYNNHKTIRFSSIIYRHTDYNDISNTITIQSGRKKYCFKMLNKKGVKKMNEVLDKKQTKANKSKSKGGTNIEDYYLATSCRYGKSITTLLPFGNLEDCQSIYGDQFNSEYNTLNQQKEANHKAVTDVHNVGTSQYGVYFRLVKKNLFDNGCIQIAHKSTDHDKFMEKRSFLFEVKPLLNYLQQKANELKIYNIPVFWYSDGNHYGDEYLTSDLLKCKKNTNIETLCEHMIENVQHDKHLYEHECVSRLQIPLSEEAGYVGKISNFRTEAELEQYDEEFKRTQMERIRMLIQSKINEEKERCKQFNENEEECKANNCWYHSDSGRCDAHRTMIRDTTY